MTSIVISIVKNVINVLRLLLVSVAMVSLMCRHRRRGEDRCHPTRRRMWYCQHGGRRISSNPNNGASNTKNMLSSSRQVKITNNHNNVTVTATLITRH
jgi:hypothetical protein